MCSARCSDTETEGQVNRLCLQAYLTPAHSEMNMSRRIGKDLTLPYHHLEHRASLQQFMTSLEFSQPVGPILVPINHRSNWECVPVFGL